MCNGAWERICWALMWTLAFLKYPRYNSGTVPMREYKVLRHKHERQRLISQKTRKLFGPEGKFQKKNLLNSTTIPSPLTDQNCFVYWYFYCSIFKVIETLILNANTTNTKQLSGPKSYRDFRETVARSLCVHRFRSVAVHCFVLAAKLLFKMESDRVKWSNYVHGYMSRVLAQCVNTTPSFSDLPQLTY